MAPIDRLRHAAALAHVLEDVGLHLSGCRGEVQVTRGPEADISPCAFRRLVAAAGNGPEALRIDEVTACGAGVCEVPCGAVVLPAAPDRRRWAVTTSLVPALVEAVLGDAAEAAVQAGTMDGSALSRVRVSCFGDNVLGITVVVFDAPVGAARRLGHGVVDALAASLYAAELLAPA